LLKIILFIFNNYFVWHSLGLRGIIHVAMLFCMSFSVCMHCRPRIKITYILIIRGWVSLTLSPLSLSLSLAAALFCRRNCIRQRTWGNLEELRSSGKCLGKSRPEIAKANLNLVLTYSNSGAFPPRWSLNTRCNSSGVCMRRLAPNRKTTLRPA